MKFLPQLRCLVRLVIRSGLRPAIVIALLIYGLGACDPCFGTSVCRHDAKVDLIGRIVDATSGVSVRGAKVSVALSSGSTLLATTDANGNWETTGPAPAADGLEATATVTAPGHPAYTVPVFPVTPSVRSGDAMLLGTWLSHPYARYLAGLTYKGKPLANASVTFRPTGGVPVAGSVTGSTNAIGAFELDFAGDQPGAVVGDLTVSHPSLSQPSVLHGYTIPLGYQYGIPTVQAVYQVGGLLTYGALLFIEGTTQPAPGVGVKWVRTGGMRATPATYSTVTSTTGFFLLPLKPAGYGEVTGTLTFSPPGGLDTIYTGVRMSTYDSTAYRYLGTFTVKR